LLLAWAALAAACGTPPREGGAVASEATGSATAPPQAFTAPVEVDAARSLAHVRVLAGDIGVRQAGSPGERRAAEYIRDQLRSFGYTATIEPFTVDVPSDESRVLEVPDAPQGVEAVAMAGAPDGEARGRLVQVGLGRPEDLEGRNLAGAVAFADRGVTPFREKALNVQRAGAVALVVANNQPGPFRGTIAEGSERVTIPVVGVTSDDAELIDEVLGRGGLLTVRALRKREPYQSQNVVARPSAEACTAYVGAHYDSVPQGPGANDNASGAASMLELARTHRVPGLCYLAFGAEEVGLVGSAAFVREHRVGSERFMLNLDMLGKVTAPEMAASPDDVTSWALAERASRAAATAGRAIPRGTFPAFASSDHASFARAGVPAVTVHSGDDGLMHTPQDTVANVSVDDLRLMLRAAQAVLRDQLATGQ
jgi:aminopeptidase YwaD